MRRSAAMKKQVKAMQSMDERMARIEQALGITPPANSLPEGGEGEAESLSVNWDDLGSYTLAQLREIAAAHEIDITGSKVKDEVVQAILSTIQDDAEQVQSEETGEENAGDEPETGAEE